MKMSVNTSGVPLNTTKPMPDGCIVGGNETDITSHPYQVWPSRADKFYNNFEIFDQNRPPVFVMTKS